MSTLKKNINLVDVKLLKKNSSISSIRIMQFISKLPNFSDDFILNSGCGTPYFPPKK